MLNEVADAERANLDVEHVARYDGKEDAGAIEELALLSQSSLLDAGSVVVDLGAGTSSHWRSRRSALESWPSTSHRSC